MTKYIAWILIGVATGGAWIFYFAVAPTLLIDLFTGQAHPIAYSSMALLAATTFFFGGIAREQICIYACPWPRIQAAMMDEDTLTVGYRHWRGEPRGKHRKGAGAEALGDCIDCMACVNVCPMGIDIRDGQQLECITCALCIDACDDVMAKIGKPRGLIDYLALKDEPREIAGEPPRPVWQHILRPRTILYTALWAAVGIGLIFALFIRSDIDMTVAPVRNPTYVVQSDGAIRNIYDLRLRNKHGEARQFHIRVTGDDTLIVSLQGEAGDIATVAADEMRILRTYVEAPAGSDAATSDRTEFTFWVEDLASDERASNATVFNGKGQ